jgi:hypothetical protein
MLKKSLIGFSMIVAACTTVSHAQTPPTGNYSGNTDSFNDNSCSSFGSNNVITCAWSRADFSEALGEAMVSKMPDKNNPVNLTSIGGNMDQQIGNKV